MHHNRGHAVHRCSTTVVTNQTCHKHCHTSTKKNTQPLLGPSKQTLQELNSPQSPPPMIEFSRIGRSSPVVLHAGAGCKWGLFPSSESGWEQTASTLHMSPFNFSRHPTARCDVLAGYGQTRNSTSTIP
jgi:hypothetical protein